MHIDMHIDMHIGMHIDMCIDMRIGMQKGIIPGVWCTELANIIFKWQEWGPISQESARNRPGKKKSDLSSFLNVTAVGETAPKTPRGSK